MASEGGSGGPLRIGLIASGLFNIYNHLVWEGISDFCRERNAAFLYFTGGELESADPTQRSRHYVFNLASEETVDGLLVNSATTFHYVGEGTVRRFYERRASVPIVSIGVKVGDWPAVMTDGAIGSREAILHLVNEHRLRRIAFIAGPERHFESNERLGGYHQALEESGIEYDRRLVAHGNFLLASGSSCLDELIARGGSFDAVMTANDEMALGVVSRANELGISVPGQLAVCGFDDTEDALMAPVPLSTVRQPIVEESREACRLLFERIEDGRDAADAVLPTKFIARRSCGCISREASRAAAAPRIPSVPPRDEATAGSEAAEALEAGRESVIEAIRPCAPGGAEGFERSCRALLESLIAHLRSGGSEDAIAATKRALADSVASGAEGFGPWEDAVTLLRSAAYPLIPSSSAAARAEGFWHRARVLVAEASYQSHFRSKVPERAVAARRRDVNWRIIRSFEVPKLLDTLRTELPRLGVKACYLCLTGPAGSSARPTAVDDEADPESRLLLAFDETGAEPLPPAGITFRTRSLLPPAVRAFSRPGDFFIEALFLENERLGFLVFRTDPGAVDFEDLRRQISSALKGALLNAEVRTLAESERRRASELAGAYDALKANQQRMLAIEKMASMGRLTAGIAHEMNTPIATVRASLKELGALIDEYEASVGDGEVGPDDHKAIAADMRGLSAMADKAAERAASFIQSVKSRTRDLARTDAYDFDASPVIEEAIFLLGHYFKRENCPAEFKRDGRSHMLHGVAGSLSQVVTNLLVNAIEASKPKGGGPVTVELMEDGEAVIIRVSDEGTGIPEDVMPMIFDPMFTTKSLAEGTGLGLTIAQDIVTGEFGGSIQAESAFGAGSSFTVRIPKKTGGGNDA